MQDLRGPLADLREILPQNVFNL